MTTDLTMLAWTAAFTMLLWIPYISYIVLTAGLMDALTYKADEMALPGWAARSKKAHYNAIENLAPFAALVIVAHLAGKANDVTALATVAYFLLRVAHYALYMTNVPFGRTLTFAGAWLAMLCIFWQIVS